MSAERSKLASWDERAVVYVLDVPSFLDSNADGVGDLRGVIRKLDYLADVGITALCLLPFQPAARGNGHDLLEHRQVAPSCGTLSDFGRMVREAHYRGMRVLVDIVVGHTSDQHPWFQKARIASPRSLARRCYVWRRAAPDPRAHGGEGEPGRKSWAWDDKAGAWYRFRRSPGEPVLDLGEPQVMARLVSVMRFWLRRGADGIRLVDLPDAQCAPPAAAPPCAALLRDIHAALLTSHPDCVLLASTDPGLGASPAPVAGGAGRLTIVDRSIAPRLFMALSLEDARLLSEGIERSNPAGADGIKLGLMWRDHEPLDLRTLTDEEGQYLLQAYATQPEMRLPTGIRRRLASLADSDPARLRLVFSLLLSLRGIPFIYYGDEINMGDNVCLDGTDGLRTPMQWNAGINAGFSDAEPARLLRPVNQDQLHGYLVSNVESQQRNPASFLYWLKRTLAVRRHYDALATGRLHHVRANPAQAFAFVREDEDTAILCVANLSRLPQRLELDLAAYHGRKPVELSSREDYPAITPKPYALNLHGRGFAWFELLPAARYHSCFISYSTQDQAFVDALQAALEREGVQCYKASRDLEVGQPIREALLSTLVGVDRVIAVMSDGAIASDWVRLEVEATFERAARAGESLLIPVRLGAGLASDQQWVQRLLGLKFSDLSRWREPAQFRAGLGELLAALLAD